jgi:hypothetical protein
MKPFFMFLVIIFHRFPSLACQSPRVGTQESIPQKYPANSSYPASPCFPARSKSSVLNRTLKYLMRCYCAAWPTIPAKTLVSSLVNDRRQSLRAPWQPEGSKNGFRHRSIILGTRTGLGSECDRFNVVARGTDDKRPVILWVILCPETRRTIVGPACPEGCGVEGVDLRAVLEIGQISS